MLFLALVFVFLMPIAHGADWEFLNDEDNVKVLKRVEPGSSLVEFRGEGQVKGDFKKVVSVLFDTKRAKEWADHVAESRIDHWVNDHQWVEYDHMWAPFIVADRDFVSEGTAQTHVDGYDFLLSFKATTDKNLPETKHVRGTITYARAGVTKTKDPNIVDVVLEAKVDPNGALPHWLVNLAQKGWAVRTLHNLREEVQKPDIKVDPFIEKLFSRP